MFSEDALRILKQRYFLKDEAGRVTENSEAMLTRVAMTVAGAEAGDERNYWAERFYHLMAAKRFLPNSPTLANAGKQHGQLAACFVLPVPDSIEGIFDTMKRAALIHKTGGGTGFSFSNIRPKGDGVSTTGGLASGPVPFITAFNCATDAIKQGGMRRGANMAVLDCRHPDIYEFIRIKEKEGSLSNFNVSVAMDGEVMAEILTDGVMHFINPRDGRAYGKPVQAGELFEAIATAGWQNGEPGVLFFDHINAANTVPGLGPLRATNPCGEQPLFDYECCNLGSLNLPAYFIEEAEGMDEFEYPERGRDFRKRIDWVLLKEDVETAVRFLDNVIDVNDYIFPEIREITMGNRKIGLGVMGFADLLILLGISYASEEGHVFAETLMAYINQTAREASEKLAEEKGSFPNLGYSIYNGRKMRNATVTTIAPTGTISMLAGVSSGIEPLFGLSYIKEALEGKAFQITSSAVEKVTRRLGWSEAFMEEAAAKNSLQEIKGVSEEVRKVFMTAQDIRAEAHIKIQAVFQKHVDNAVSKTINLPHEASVEDIKTAYILAWKLGCKGLTVYRAGSRIRQAVTGGSVEPASSDVTRECVVCTN